MQRLLVVNGPNLNMLGTREPDIYGALSLSDVEDMCGEWGAELGFDVEAFQSNHEGAIVDTIQAARGTFDGIILNGGAFTHYSYAIHDALVAADVPTVEIHISNIHAREPWRRTSVTAPACRHQIFGRGVDGYRDAIRFIGAELAHTPTSLPYGDDADQFGRLRLPDSDAPHPVIVLVHGGYWREIYTFDTLSRAAVDLTARGYATWNIEYRRIPPVGGWRATIADVAASIDHLSRIDAPLDLNRVAVMGHSAGGHLAVMASAASALTPARIVSLAGVLDVAAVLDPTDETNGAHLFLGTDDPKVVAESSPIAHVPPPSPVTVVHGTADESVSFDIGRRYAAAAAAAGGRVETLWLDGVDHMSVIEPTSDAWHQIVDAAFTAPESTGP